jgi:TolB-like protein
VGKTEKVTLYSWKEIAVYLKRTIKTCRRWEKELGLPVHRLEDSAHARVFAYRDEIDGWLAKAKGGHGPPSKAVSRYFVIAAFGLVGIGIFVIFALKPGFDKKAVYPHALENSFIVISFENQTGDKALDRFQKIIPILLITRLARAGSLHIVTWERLQNLLLQMRVQRGSFIDSNLGFELARREGAKSLVRGTLCKAGTAFTIDVLVLDVETGNLLASATSAGQEEGSLFSQVDTLATTLLEKLGYTEIPAASGRLLAAGSLGP